MKDNFLEDVIAAISTPVGNGGISIVRLSGEESVSMVSGIFKGANLLNKKSHTMSFGYIVDPFNGKTIDEVLVSVMLAPKTYTCENIVEINCHGGLQASKKVLETVLNQGARLAEPGEFTKRAFLNGRIDLTQAEAVIDIITSKTELSRQSALNQLEGSLKKAVYDLRDNLLTSIATIEASIDYPEHDIEEETYTQLSQKVTQIFNETTKLLESADRGKIVREGLSTVILGKPNVGKSSLLNYLLDEERAIVTNVPGTTRDTVEETVNIEGIPIKIVDTAGIRNTEDEVEKIGVEKAKEYSKKADLILMVIDGSKPLDDDDIEIISTVKDKKTIVILNKIDLPLAVDISKLSKEAIVPVSTINKTGVDEIIKKLKDMFFNGDIEINNHVLIGNVRHKDALFCAKNNLKNAIDAINIGMPVDLVSIDLMEAYNHYGRIVGESVDEALIDRIFSQFCLGK